MYFITHEGSAFVKYIETSLDNALKTKWCVKNIPGTYPKWHGNTIYKTNKSYSLTVSLYDFTRRAVVYVLWIKRLLNYHIRRAGNQNAELPIAVMFIAVMFIAVILIQVVIKKTFCWMEMFP